MDRGAWQATVRGTAKSRTNLSDSAHRKESQILGNKKVRCLFLSPFPLLLTDSLPDADVLLVAGSLIFSSRLPWQLVKSKEQNLARHNAAGLFNTPWLAFLGFPGPTAGQGQNIMLLLQICRKTLPHGIWILEPLMKTTMLHNVIQLPSGVKADRLWYKRLGGQPLLSY